MREITITLTDEQEKYLREFAVKQCDGSRDNVGTYHPMHVVQTRRERIINPDYDQEDKIQYAIPDYDIFCDSPQNLIKEYYKCKGEKCPIKIVSFEEAYKATYFTDVEGEEQIIFDEKEYLEAYGIYEDEYSKTYIGYYYDAVAVFFILDEAKRYIEYQGHNLTHPRTYTIGAGYANKGEYHHFWQLLFDIGDKLIPIY